MKRSVLTLILLLALVLSACQTAGSGADEQEMEKVIPVAGGSYTDISTTTLQKMLENKDFIFVNVHIPYEGDIPQTDLSIPYNQIESNLHLLPSEKDEKIVLYCQSDRMSMIASENLVKLGYTNVYNLDGGMIAWQRAGLPLE
jgi:rhodanese-related sulfurtransferase/predicted small secreted protein